MSKKIIRNSKNYRLKRFYSNLFLDKKRKIDQH